MLKIVAILMLLLLLGCEKNETRVSENNTTSIYEVPTEDENISLEQNATVQAEDINTSLEDNTTDTYIPSDATYAPDTYYYQQWYLEKNNTFYSENSIDENASIHAGGLLQKYTGKGVTIAIIDDGLDVLHQELNSSIVATYDITSKSTNVSHTRYGDYHGTAVTGIIASQLNGRGIVGLARESKIIFLKHKLGMSDSETIELFNKAEELGADIINCSWGTYDVSSAVKESIQELALNGRDGKGVIIVFATGNDGQDMGNDESSIPEVISVGSSDKENLRAWYSNYGAELDVLAPGGYDIGITTLDPTGSNGVATLEEDYLLGTDGNSFIGTSASAPIVTSIIALMLEKNPNLTRLEIEKALKNNSDKIGNVEYVDGFNKYYGSGKINASKLLNLNSKP